MTCDELRERTRDAGLSPALVGAAAVSAAAAVVAVGGLIADPDFRITGAAAWLKPLKFGISITLYCATVAWMLRYVRRNRRAARTIAVVTAVSLILELALIDLQVLRGRASHFNISTLEDKIIYQAMAALAVVAFLAAIAAAVVLAREPDVPEPLGTGIRAGLLVTIVGMAQAVFMVIHGAHTVGGPDGGPGLPLTDWSTEHGDLRVAHFVGLHALQVLPLVAGLLTRVTGDVGTRRGDRRLLDVTTARRLVTVLGAGWTGLIGLLTWQAERGLPVLEPDTSVAAGAAGLGAAVAAAIAALAGTASRRSTRRWGQSGSGS